MWTSLPAIMTYAYDGLEESLLGSSAASLTSARPRLRMQGLTDSEPSTWVDLIVRCSVVPRMVMALALVLLVKDGVNDWS